MCGEVWVMHIIPSLYAILINYFFSTIFVSSAVASL